MAFSGHFPGVAALFPFLPVVFQATLWVKGQLRVRPLGIEGFQTSLAQAIVFSGRCLGIAVLKGRRFLSAGELHPAQLLQPVKVPLEAVIAALGQLVRDPA